MTWTGSYEVAGAGWLVHHESGCVCMSWMQDFTLRPPYSFGDIQGHRLKQKKHMATNQIGPVARAWYRWKALRLPWRKRFLVGLFSIFPPTTLLPLTYHQVTTFRATRTGNFDSREALRVMSAGEELLNTRDQHTTLP